MPHFVADSRIPRSIMATAMVNGVASTTDPNVASTAMPNTGKQQPKSTFGNKAAESNRKQPESPNDGAQR